MPVDSGRPTVPTNTKDPPLSRKASNIDNKTGGKTTVTPKKTATSSIKTGIKPEMTLSQASIPFNWTIQTNDFGQFTYFMIVLIGVIVSRFYQRFQNGGRDMTTEDFLWAGIAAIIALLVFSTFQAAGEFDQTYNYKYIISIWIRVWFR